MLSSASRLIIFIPIAVWMSKQDGFTENQIWYVSVLSVTLQAVISFLLVQKEMALKLKGLQQPETLATVPT